MTVVMLDVMSTKVLQVPTGTFSQPCGQKPSGAPTRSRMYRRKQSAEKHHFGRQEQPDADLGVVKPGVGPGLNGVRDIHNSGQTGSFCGVKSVAWPGTLYS